MGSLKINGVSFNLEPIKAFKSKDKFMKYAKYSQYDEATLKLLWEAVHPKSKETETATEKEGE